MTDLQLFMLKVYGSFIALVVGELVLFYLLGPFKAGIIVICAIAVFVIGYEWYLAGKEAK